ncbi:MAG TPA: carboxypeptidase-like regulatory domain-containing protein [Kofleriaceae bacterium]|nr:carboxypeptidase-like regulatory domain-containing protein [Kofleriaceae bacterium]
MAAIALGGAVACALAGCVGGVNNDDAGPVGTGGGSGSGAAGMCNLNFLVAPMTPVAGPGTVVHVTAQLFEGSGLLDYQWTVDHDGSSIATTMVDGDPSQIEFAAPDPGVYDVGLVLDGAPPTCATKQQAVNVRAPGAPSETLRLRVLPPRGTTAPPLELFEPIFGGAEADLGTMPVESGTPTTVQVTDPSGAGVPAYVRLSPGSTSDAIVEAFTGSDGSAAVTLYSGPDEVLVVPSVPGLAPRQIEHWIGGPIALDAGQAISGVVRDPSGAVLAGAQVQVTIGGVPSTLATTAGDGSFTVAAEPAIAGASVTVDVAPPATSGLPRLSATSMAWSLDTPVQIRYAANVTRRNLTGLVVRRGGAPVGNARVTVVGAVGAVGTVTAGAAATASGEVAIATTSNAAGVLPSVMVPAAALSAVIAVGAGDLAVAALDTSAGVPASLDAPAMQLITTAVTDAHGDGLGNTVLDLVPAGALAQAAAPPLQVVADATGAITATLATGGHYDLRFHDPSGRGAPTVIADLTPATIATSITLGPTIAIRGTLLYGGISPLASASVQFLCEDCTGIERTRPIVEGVTDEAGRFTLAIPDPGKM